ncbi:hypothetical protein BDAP_002502 [Binucleata daphniae]
MIFVVTKTAAEEGGEEGAEGGEGGEGGEEGGEEEGGEDAAKSSGEITVCSNPCLENDGFASDKPSQDEAAPTVKVECVHGTEAKPLADSKKEDEAAGGEEGGEGGEGGGESALKKKRRSGLKRKNHSSNASKSRSKLVGL